MLRHDPEPTAAIAATSGRPCGLHTTASHTGGMVAPSDPGVRATQVGGFTFGKWDPHSSTLQVQAEKAGIGRIAGLLMGKILVIPHFPPPRGETHPRISAYALGCPPGTYEISVRSRLSCVVRCENVRMQNRDRVEIATRASRPPTAVGSYMSVQFGSFRYP